MSTTAPRRRLVGALAAAALALGAQRPAVSHGPVGEHAVAWLKRWVDGDTRYDRFLCPALAADEVLSEFRDTCPLG